MRGTLMNEREVNEIQRRALEECRITLTEIAEVLGVSRSAAEKYHQGERTMPDAVRRKLSAFLREHADRVSTLADELDPDD